TVTFTSSSHSSTRQLVMQDLFPEEETESSDSANPVEVVQSSMSPVSSDAAGTAQEDRESQDVTWEFIGCFVDDQDRGFEISLGRVADIALCASHCRYEHLSAYFSLQDGNFCFCTRRAISVSIGVGYRSTPAETEFEEEVAIGHYDIEKFYKVPDSECTAGYSGVRPGPRGAGECDPDIFGGYCGAPWRNAIFRFVQ
ncbi:unnamed protein product, partial [Amoebophrya sp. A25]